MKAPLKYLKAIGKKGGKSKSEKKIKAVLKNLEKANLKRGIKPNPLNSSSDAII